MAHAAIERHVLDGMARAIWVHAYMEWALDADPPPELYWGATWDDTVPDDDDTRSASRQAAEDLCGLIGEANRLGRHPLEQMFRASGVSPRAGVKTEAEAAYAFGENLALVCIGARERTPLLGNVRLPRFTAALEEDGHNLQWEGDMERAAVVNPARTVEILVLEDEPRLQVGVTRMLRQIFGDAPAITIVDNVGAAIGYLECHTYSLIVSDVNVCGRRTGIDLFRHVQAEYPQMVDKFVFFTDNQEAAQMHYRYLEKPATAKDLRRVLHAARPGAPADVRPSSHRAREYSHEDRARVVLEIAPGIRTQRSPDGRTEHRFGDKVFISAIWSLVRDRPEFAGWTLDQFKRWLVTANQMRLLNLARADLVGAMVASEVQASEINHMGASFHFVDVTPVAPSRSQARAPSRAALVSDDERAAVVLETIPSIQTVMHGERFGQRIGEKVFISAIWRRVQMRPEFAGWTLDLFKKWLVNANRDGLLAIRRADALGAMVTAEVEESEILDRGAAFHFVVDPNFRY